MEHKLRSQISELTIVKNNLEEENLKYKNENHILKLQLQSY